MSAKNSFTSLKCLFIIGSFLFLDNAVITQKLPAHHVLQPNELAGYLKKDVQARLSKNGIITQKALAQYLREKFSERYFYDWKTFEKRFGEYNAIYPGRQVGHAENAKDHLSKYADSTQWVLPFNYLTGQPVNAYALRHLARQHKTVDIAFQYFYEQKDPQYIRYFVRQVKSLNAALVRGEYEKIEDGNGVYEVFRAGYRVLNWLQIHNMLLGEAEYSNEDQLTLIATLLQTGAHLYETNPSFDFGNHQTRGMSALAMIAILLRDFEGTDQWYDRAMGLLKEHLTKEINDDGFQFERSVHYHISDIGNYYYVYQLAKISGIKVDEFWEERLRSLFTTLTKIAYPDLTAPVLQDDTDNPWAEKNNISGAVTLGYLLFESPEFGYFADDRVEAKMYWYLNQAQLDLLKNIKKESPGFTSLSFPATGYYVMREGWDASDDVLIISNGLDEYKPDHQHGDMLGIQAMSNGKVILPNYQVRYSLKDFDFFKNSLVKNVALVDDELQGKAWTSNQGGSGFGKFKNLPNPTTTAWETNPDFDFYAGSHDGFENVGVEYSRQVIYVKNDFWIVKDNFRSGQPHEYKQVWQGHYSHELQPDLLRATFDDATGCDILQLRPIDKTTQAGTRGKHWSIASKSGVNNFNFITVIFPYAGYSHRIDEEVKNAPLKGWHRNQSDWEMAGEEPVSLSQNEESFFFDVLRLKKEGVSIDFSETTDAYVFLKNGKFKIQMLGNKAVEVVLSGVKNCRINKAPVDRRLTLKPADALVCDCVK